MYLQFGQFVSVSRGSLILNTPIHPLVKEGTTKMPTSNIKKQSILLQASDCTLQADLVKKLQLPDIVHTSLNPVYDYQAPCHCETDSILGGNMPERIWIEESQVHRPTHRSAKSVDGKLDCSQ